MAQSSPPAGPGRKPAPVQRLKRYYLSDADRDGLRSVSAGHDIIERVESLIGAADRASHRLVPSRWVVFFSFIVFCLTMTISVIPALAYSYPQYLGLRSGRIPASEYPQIVQRQEELMAQGFRATFLVGLVLLALPLLTLRRPISPPALVVNASLAVTRAAAAESPQPEYLARLIQKAAARFYGAYTIPYRPFGAPPRYRSLRATAASRGAASIIGQMDRLVNETPDYLSMADDFRRLILCVADSKWSEVQHLGTALDPGAWSVGFVRGRLMRSPEKLLAALTGVLGLLTSVLSIAPLLP